MLDKGVDRNKEVLTYEQKCFSLYMLLKIEIDNVISNALKNSNDIAYLLSLQNQINKKVEKYKPKFKELTKEATGKIYKEAAKITDTNIKSLNIPAGISTNFGILNIKALDILADNMYNSFEQAVQSIGRQANDNLRQLGLEAVKGQITGYQTQAQTKIKLAEQIKSKIGTHVTYSNGRQVPADVYAKMVAATTTSQIHRTATQNRILQVFDGNDAVEIIGPKDEKNRPACSEFVNTLVSIGGLTKGLPLMEEYTSKGGFGVNCRHDMGVTQKVIDYYDKIGA